MTDPRTLGAGRILIVDDEPSVGQALVALLSSEHEGCVWVANAPQALELAAFGAFELVLTDLRMPSVDGLELLRALTALDPDLPVLLMAEASERDAAGEAVRARAFDFLWKPSTPAQLLEAVARGLHARREAVAKRARELDSRERLERRSALLSVLFEQGSDGVLTWNAHGRLVDVSPSTLALTGSSLEQVLAKGTSELFEREPFGQRIDELIPELSAQLAVSSSRQLTREVVVRTRQGPAPARLLLDLCELPPREGGGKPVRWIMGLLQPHHSHLHERLRRADSLSSAAMIAMASAHEIKNDLGPLLTYLSLLEDSGPQDPDMLELLDAARSSLRRASKLVERILAPLASERPHRRNIDVSEVVRRSVAFVRRSSREQRSRIELSIASPLPPVRARPDDLHQIVMNLVRNAFDAVALGRREGLTPAADPPEIHVILREAPQLEQLVLEVHDQGPGIEPTQRGRVFEPFYTTKGVEGTGLGLTVVRDLVRELGGELSIESIPERTGTCVRVRLPTHGAALPERL